VVAFKDEQINLFSQVLSEFVMVLTENSSID